jgi:DNA-directed RNA polymerase subunit L
MELNVLEKSKNKLMLEIIGEDHTLLNALKEELKDDKNVKLVAYKIEHPLISNPVLLVEGDKPEKLIENALKKLKKSFSEMQTLAKSKLK